MHVGEAHHRDLGDRGVVGYRPLDLGGHHRFATRADEVLGPADDAEVPVLVHHRQVARPVPAVGQDLGRGLGVLEIAAEDERSADAELAVVLDANLAVRGEGSAAAGLAADVLVPERGDASGFGRSVEDPDVGPGKGGLHLREQLERRGRGPGVGESERGEVGAGPLVATEVVEDAPPHAWYGVDAPCAVSGDGLADRRGVGRAHEDDRVPGLPLLQRDRPGTHVEKRVGGEHGPSRLEQGAGVRTQEVDPMRQDRPLGAARAPAGKEDHVRVVLARALDRGVGVGCEPGLLAQLLEADHGHAEPLADRQSRAEPVRPGDDQGGPRRAHDRGRLVDLQSRVGRDEDDAQLRRRGEDRRQSQLGSRPGDEPIAETEPAAGEHCGDAVGLGVELAEGHDLIPEDRGGPAGHRPGRIGEDGTDA